MTRRAPASSPPPDTSTAMDQAASQFDNFRTAALGSPCKVRVYRRDPHNPGDINGRFIGSLPWEQSFDEETIARSFGGGVYRIQLVDTSNSTIKRTIGAIEIEGEPIERQQWGSPTPPPPGPSFAPVAAPTDIATLIANLQGAIVDAVRGASKPKTIGEMSGEEFAQLMAKALPRTDPPPTNAEQFLDWFPKMAGVLSSLGPRSGFEEAINAYKALEALKEGKDGGGGEPSGMAAVLGQVIELVKTDPLARKALERVINGEDAQKPAPRRKPVPNTAGQQPAPNPPAATERQQGDETPAASASATMPADVPPEVASVLPAVAEGIAAALQAEPNMSPVECARSIVEGLSPATPEMIAGIVLPMPIGMLAQLLGKQDEALKKRPAFMFMVEGALRADLEAATEEDDEDGAQDDGIAGKVGAP